MTHAANSFKDKTKITENLNTAIKLNSFPQPESISHSPISQVNNSLEKAEPIAIDPFALSEFYNLNQIPTHSPDREATIALDDKATARKLLIAALKLGEDRYYDLVSFLLDDAPLFAKQQAEINRAFTKNQNVLLPIKQHLCIITSMQDILRDVLDYLDNEKPGSIAEYYKGLATRLSRAQEDYIQGHFEELVGRFLTNQEDIKDAWKVCMAPLRAYLSNDGTTSEKGYFSLSLSISLEADYFYALDQLQEKLRQAMELLGNGRDGAQLKYQSLREPVGELENDLRWERGQRKLKLASHILLKMNSENKAGIPYAYKQMFTVPKELEKLGGVVPYDAGDPDSGNGIALIALQYRNKRIYKDFFSSHKELAKTARNNALGLSAENYDKMLFWEDRQERAKGHEEILAKDANGELLRAMEKAIHQYLQGWHKTDTRLSEVAHSDFLEKIAVGFMKFFMNEKLFKQRCQEANQYLAMVHKAQKDIPVGFYKAIKEQLLLSDWGLTSGSQLHNAISYYFTTIQHNEIYHGLINQSEELLERVQELERQQKVRNAKNELEKKEKDEENTRAFCQQKKEIEGNFRAQIIEMKEEHKQEIAIQKSAMENKTQEIERNFKTQEIERNFKTQIIEMKKEHKNDIDKQKSEIENLKQNMQAILEKLSVPENSNNSYETHNRGNATVFLKKCRFICRKEKSSSSWISILMQ